MMVMGGDGCLLRSSQNKSKQITVATCRHSHVVVVSTYVYDLLSKAKNCCRVDGRQPQTNLPELTGELIGQEKRFVSVCVVDCV